MEKYGLSWKPGTSPALIEKFMLQGGGQWEHRGRTVGLGLVHHFKEYWKLLWPDDFQTWWTDLILKEILEHQYCAVVGGASAGKTATVSRIAIMDWSLFPDCTTVMVSSVTIDDVRNRIYAEIQKLWNLARLNHPWFPGYPIDSKYVITFEEASKDKARDMRNSVVGIPARSSTGKFQGMARFAGRKNRRVWSIGDEFQFMELSMLEAQNNLISNGPNLNPGMVRSKDSPDFNKPRRGYKCIFIGNPNPSKAGNPLDFVCEPEGGWGSIPEDGKTKCWDAKKLHDYPVKCRVINLDSLDSPNSAYPIDNPRWVHMAGPHKLKQYTEGSEAYWSQGRGVFKFGLTASKIITKEICDAKHAFDEPVWRGTERTRIGMVDAAYGGGDRCILSWLEFGECVDGRTRICFRDIVEVPIRVNKDMTPEDQIAVFVREKMVAVGVAPQNFFFDGRGSMAMSFAQHWSPSVNAIEFGGKCTDRVAGPDLFVWDRERRERRPKLANEHYSKFVTELWWSMRYAIDADQVRGLQMQAVLDAQPREWYKVAGDKMEIEPKRDMKKRTGCSPDIWDAICTGLEGARRRGFAIEALASPTAEEMDLSYLNPLRERVARLKKDHALTYS